MYGTRLKAKKILGSFAQNVKSKGIRNTQCMSPHATPRRDIQRHYERRPQSEKLEQRDKSWIVSVSQRDL